MANKKTEYSLIDYAIQPDVLLGWGDLSIPTKKYVDDQIFIAASGNLWEYISGGDMQAVPSITGSILPSTDDISDLGSSSYRFKDLYLGSKIDASTYLDFWTNGSSRIYINSSGNIGIGTTSPNSASILDLTSTTGGFLPPRMTTAQINAISSPADGLTVYNTDQSTLCFYDGTNLAWRKVSHSAM